MKLSPSALLVPYVSLSTLFSTENLKYHETNKITKQRGEHHGPLRRTYQFNCNRVLHENCFSDGKLSRDFSSQCPSRSCVLTSVGAHIRTFLITLHKRKSSQSQTVRKFTSYSTISQACLMSLDGTCQPVLEIWQHKYYRQ